MGVDRYLDRKLRHCGLSSINVECIKMLKGVGH